MHVIVGAGPVGSTTARLLADRGERVRVITRRGTGPADPGIELVAADATDAARLSELAAGAAALYNCANPLYHRWLTDWPPLADALLRAAESSGAVLATAGNLYGYGPVTAPIDEHTPLAATHPKLRLRARMWEDALALHQAGRIRATEARASDYIGFQANSTLGDYVLAPTVKGRRAFVWGDPDAPHSWTSIRDVARTLVTIAGDERAWGRAWLVPTPPAVSVRRAAALAGELIGAPAPKISRIPYPVLWTMGLFSPIVKELRTTYYQFEAPFTMDSSLTERTFGLAPTPLDETLAETAARYRDA
ncbi:NAD-dependent epimerase/dehydratase family protein [Catellatospora sp. KI3]|uniref:NAD-dependent epimerase/dehydratase family protein n=1 Tax=Catellatospora sp. KI3 TaxID=3041620 RepID=UPI0024829667|nr:NAD-dependent epimerase/dehydratase family protein [Catellatospora sp. KI3]MDI1459900.1 NAD-dependent epimerase/dehydratase family protein [Catellatospora sp. KI3]